MSSKHLASGSPFPAFKDHKLRIYSMLFCPYAERPRLVCAAKQIAYEVVNCNLQSKPEWLLERNPLGKVPTLEHDDGRVLYESLIVCEYLDTIYPQNKLIPQDAYEKARQQILIEAYTNVTNAFYKLIRSKDEQTIEELNKALDYFELNLKDDYFGGKQAMFVDYMIWPWFERIPILGDFSSFKWNENRFAKLTQWIERMKQTEAVKQCLISPKAFSAFFRPYVSGGPIDYDIDVNE
jgi:glutathione S-transferase